MSLDKTRFLRTFRDPRTLDELSEQFADLRHILFSALQEIEVLKKMLRKGVSSTPLATAKRECTS